MLKLRNGHERGELDGTEGPERARVLVVDDDPIVAESLADFLKEEGHEVSSCGGGVEALEALSEAERAASGAARRVRPFNIVLTDVSMPGMSGLELLRRISQDHPRVVVLMLTGYGTIESAVEAIRAGASDYLSKPVVDSELLLALDRALRQQALLAENHLLRDELDRKSGMGSLVGGDYRMQKAYELIEAVAPSKATVLITGESGTGKSMVARAIHEQSPRRGKPFVEIHCGSIPETLLESELFGHIKGAFTGAHTDKQGKFLSADGGTLFIDEINSASPGMQLKLLRVLQERRFEPVGSTETVEIDVRVVLATNQSLEAMVAAGQFRQDLYYRINVVKIELPPLRERASDVPDLIRHFVEEMSREHGKVITQVSAEAVDAIKRYPFPGNVRELRNVIERAVVLARTPTIGEQDLPPHLLSASAEDAARASAGSGCEGSSLDSASTPWVPTALEVALQEPEKRILLKALKANQWNRQATADQLQINRTTLYKKLKAYGLDKE